MKEKDVTYFKCTLYVHTSHVFCLFLSSYQVSVALILCDTFFKDVYVDTPFYCYYHSTSCQSVVLHHLVLCYLVTFWSVQVLKR